MRDNGVSFPVALWATRAGNVFTSHTPVAAGFDTFPADLMARYFSEYASSLEISIAQLLALGRHNPDDPAEPFNMSLLALRGSIDVNGVSRAHEETTRKIFLRDFPRWPAGEIPIKHVTNGVHVPSWDSQWSDSLWTEAGGRGCWQGTLEHLTPAIQDRSDIELWSLRNSSREALVSFVRGYLARQLQQGGAPEERLQHIEHVLDPNVLTVGFARRFTDYKRPCLLLYDRDRLARIINNSERPVQVIAAGKAHTQDAVGKDMIHEFVQFSLRPDVAHRVVFLADYDMSIAAALVQGVDLWLNTPRPPWEACGTSGMKVLVNGGLNLSELDGWWKEAYEDDVGWALGDGRIHEDEGWDAVEAGWFYNLLENRVTREFYARDDRGVPPDWINRIRASMSKLAPRFSSNRMLREYAEHIYADITPKYRERTADNGRLAEELLKWQNAIARNWHEVHFGAGAYIEKDGFLKFAIPVYFGGLNADFARIEIYAEPLTPGDDAVRQIMTRGDSLPAVNAYTYYTEVPSGRPAGHFSFRAVPFHPAVRVPLEEHHILWYRIPTPST
jgi:glycogen phosphorylase